jgi:hypothetical protein
LESNIRSTDRKEHKYLSWAVEHSSVGLDKKKNIHPTAPGLPGDPEWKSPQHFANAQRVPVTMKSWNLRECAVQIYAIPILLDDGSES